MKFSIGERVSILNETGNYTILDIGDTFAQVEDEQGFDQKVSLSLIVKTKPIIKDDDDSCRSKARKELGLIPSIDLHF